MDVTWFAVDRDGHIAIFDSGEGGAVPAEVSDGDVGFRTTKQLGGLLAPKQPPPRGVHAKLAAGVAIMIGDAEKLKPFAITVEEHAEGSWSVHFGSRPIKEASFMKGVKSFGGEQPPSPFERVHELGLCEGCRKEEADDNLFDCRVAAEKLGLYLYACEAALAEPYERVFTPAQPLRAEDIGNAVRTMAKFDGSFASVDKLQPAEHWKKVDAYGASYVTMTGALRCIPGREREYRKDYQDYKDDFADAEKPKGWRPW